MSEVNTVLNSFLKTVDVSITETIANSTVQGSADFERGVKEGALGLADQLQATDYVITDKEGAVVDTAAPAEGDKKETFSQAFLSDIWKDPNT